MGRRAIYKLGRPFLFLLRLFDNFVAQEAWLVGRGEQPCPHPVGYRNSVLLLGYPLE